MKYKKFDEMNCSLAQTLDIVGERWTLLILRDAFFGTCKFSQFQANLGIARNILTTRLARLVDEGIFERTAVNQGGHADYRLTNKGLALQPILLSMTHWGDEFKANPKGMRLTFVERETGLPIRPMSATSQEGRSLLPREIKAVSGSARNDRQKN
jgi:DNA-binding HxlR family transcriptional regulator|tara:strand:- start:245 stop:709 length:465 start_codon:yes stop_codon:yes gene_type:complete